MKTQQITGREVTVASQRSRSRDGAEPRVNESLLAPIFKRPPSRMKQNNEEPSLKGVAISLGK
jgi:hypothetical protein